MTQSVHYQRVAINATLHKLLFNKHLKKFNGVLKDNSSLKKRLNAETQ
jgi:hypothetical protein